MRLRSDPYKFFIFVHILISLFILFLLLNFTSIEHWICILTALNTSGFIIVGYDKSIAGGKDERVPEQVLYGIALFGASLGVLLSMQFFRHKTKKASFQFVLGIILVIQILLIKVLKY
jgi:uncharacterized membrane protein YsdA (DUF1294 family)